MKHIYQHIYQHMFFLNLFYLRGHICVKWERQKRRDRQTDRQSLPTTINLREGNLLMLFATRISILAPFKWSPRFTWICNRLKVFTR